MSRVFHTVLAFIFSYNAEELLQNDDLMYGFVFGKVTLI